jgi:chromosome segregation ATPase
MKSRLFADEIEEDYRISKQKLEERLRDLRQANEIKQSQHDTASAKKKALEKEIEKNTELAKASRMKSGVVDKKIMELKRKLVVLTEEEKTQAEQAAQATSNFKMKEEKLERGIRQATVRIAAIKAQRESLKHESEHAVAQRQTVLKKISHTHQTKMKRLESSIAEAKSTQLKAEKESMQIIKAAAARQRKVIALGRHAQHVLEDKEAQLSARLAAKKKSISDAVAEDTKQVQKNEDEVDNAKGMLKKLTDEEHRLLNKIAQHTTEQETLKGELQRIQAKGAESLKWKVMEAHEVVKQKEAKLELANVNIDKHEHVIKLLKEKLGSTETSEHNAELRLLTEEKRKAHLQNAVDDLSPSLEKEKDELATAEAQKQRLFKEEHQFESRVRAQQDALYNEDDAVSKVGEVVRKEAEALALKQSIAAKTAQELGRLQARTDRLEALHRTRQGKVAAINAQGRDMHAELASEQSRLDRDDEIVTSKQKKLAAAHAAEQKLRSVVRKESTENQDKMQSLDALDKKLAQAEKIVEVESEKVNDEESMTESERMKYEAAHDKDAQLKAESARLHGNIMHVKQMLEREKGKANSDSKMIEMLEAQSIKAKEDLAKFKTDAMQKEQQMISSSAAKENVKKQLDAALAETKKQAASISLEKQQIRDTDDELTSTEEQLKEEDKADKSLKAALGSKLKQKTNALREVTSQTNALEETKPRLQAEITNLDAETVKLHDQIVAINDEEQNDKHKKQALDVDKGHLQKLVVRRQRDEKAEDLALGKDSKNAKDAEETQEALKAQLLEAQLTVQAETKALASKKHDATLVTREVGKLKEKSKEADQRIASINSNLENTDAQIKQLESSTNSTLNSKELHELQGKELQATEQAKEEEQKVSLAKAESMQAQESIATNKGKLDAVHARIDHTKSEVSSTKDEVLDVQHDIKHAQKKQQVIGKVQESWDRSLSESKEVLQDLQGQQKRVSQEIAALETKHSKIQQQESQQLESVNRKTSDWNSALLNTTNSFNVAHEHHMKTKALEAKTMDRLQALDEEISQSNKRLSELRERKRVLVQSKLDDLDKQTAPFHLDALQAMDKMAAANKLRADAMKKTEAIVNSTTSDQPSNMENPESSDETQPSSP